MPESRIKVLGIEFIDILRFEGLSQINEHSVFTIRGHITNSLGRSLNENLNLPEILTISYTDDNRVEETLIKGVLSRAQLTENNDVYILDLVVKSLSVLADKEPHTRSYQDRKYTYSDIAGLLSENAANFTLFHSGSKRVNQFFVQYKETNWEFFKRLCSTINLHIVPDLLLDTPYIGAGIPSRSAHVMEADRYVLEVNYEEYLKKKEKITGVSSHDMKSFIHKSRKKYDLCDTVTIDGRALYVSKIHSFVESSVLFHEYTLRPENAFRQIPYQNDGFIGATLAGTVVGISESRVTVKLDGDIRQRKYRWFDYATVYSSPDGTGWYFMPEEGDTVRLRFPSSFENEAYVISSVHQGVEYQRTDPDIKSISTVHKKSIVFSPDSIVVSNGVGSSITLDDNKGITIDTDKAMILTSYDDIEITSDSKITMQARNKITIDQNGSLINIDDDIDLASSRVRIR